MKNIMIIVMLLALSVLGCKQADNTPPPEQVAGETNTEANSPSDQPIDFDAAMQDTDGYKSGEWITDYDAALAAAQKMGRPVLVNFTGSDWCGWCIKLMDEVFSKDEFIKYASDNLVLLKLDFPRKTQLPPAEAKANEQLAQKFKVTGFPTIVLLDGTGKEINRTGYQPGGPVKYISHLKALLQ